MEDLNTIWGKKHKNYKIPFKYKTERPIFKKLSYASIAVYAFVIRRQRKKTKANLFWQEIVQCAKNIYMVYILNQYSYFLMIPN